MIYLQNNNLKYFRIYLFILSIISAGCSSLPDTTGLTTSKAYLGDTLVDSQLSIISVKCDSICKELIEERLQKTIMPIRANHLFEPIVQHIDGISGEHLRSMAFDCDSPWFKDVFNQPHNDNGYRIAIHPGHHIIGLYVHFCGAKSPEMTEVQFNTVKGHEYFVGQFLSALESESPSGYFWHPVIVDITLNSIVYPSKPEWRVY